MKLRILFIAFLLISSQSLYSQNNFLDTLFNVAGPVKGKKMISRFPGKHIRAMEVDNLGRIVAVATNYSQFNFGLFRLKSDGNYDLPFGTGATDTFAIHTSSTHQMIHSLLLQPDGKILVGGYRKDAGGATDMMVARFNSNGSLDTTFGINGFWIKHVSNNDEVIKMKFQKSGKIVLEGAVDAYSATAKIIVIRLNTDGTEDLSFNNNTGMYISTGSTAENPTGMEIVNDTIYAGGSYNASGFNIILMKLTPEGSLHAKYSIPFSTTSNAKGPIAGINGNLVFGGNDYNRFFVGVVAPNGTLKNLNNYTANASMVTLNTMLKDNNDNLILSGYGSGLISIKIDKTGQIDSTFASNGKYTNTGTAYVTALSHDNKLLIGAEEYVAGYNSPAISKVRLKPSMHIIGNDYALPQSGETYEVKINSPGSYTYVWSYTGQYANFFPDNQGSKVFLYFTDSATTGKLICRAYLPGPSLYSYEIKDITVNANASTANQLAKLKCPVKVTDCAGGYIDYFNLGSIDVDTSGCSDNGYSDYTRSNFADTLSAGGVYSASLKVEAGNLVRYVGIWIDYNNDGLFDTVDEFVAEGVSSSSEMTINNIIFKNRSGYTGAKRLRVRCRPYNPFTSTESCPVEGESGETEDYLIVLSEQAVLEAPQIITPNDDGKNDYFVIRGIDPEMENKLTIFDRWGEVKFSSENYENNWNGKSEDGERLVPGTYYYMFTTNDEFIRGFLEIRY